MFRYAAIVLWVAVVLVAGCQTIQFDRPHILSESDWPTDGRDDARSRFVDASLMPPLELAWKYNANAGFSRASALRLQDRILVGNRKGEIHAVDLETGGGRGFKQLGETIEGSALVYEGSVYVPLAWGRRTLVAYDLAAGAIRWQQRGVPFATALLGHADHILGVDLEGTLRAFDVDSGNEAWSLALAPFQTFKASPVRASASSAVFVDVQGRVYNVDLDERTLLWTKELHAPVYETPALAGEHIVLTTTRGGVYVLHAGTGTTIWAWHGPETIRMGAPAIGPSSVVVGATDGYVRSFDPSSGALQWETPFPDVVSAPPLIVGEHVFVGTLGTSLQSLNAGTGEVVWRTEVDGRIKSAMAVADGGLLVLTEPRWVLYFRPTRDESIQQAEGGTP
jgi:hypothetical protein